MARSSIASRTLPPAEPRPEARESRKRALPGPLAWIPELLAIGGLVAVVALLVSVFL